VAGCDALFFGHTHLPYQKRVGNTLFVNTGSAGKPKDGDPRAGYVIVELGRPLQVEFRRVAYDVAAAARAIRASGLPPHFADLLETGGLAPAPRPEGVRL
jgi:diadenosine tetraphosphatase ApaH/serine/threonine PP2A family protein phosphatase